MNVPPLTVNDLIHNFSTSTYVRGYTYHKENRVVKFDIYDVDKATWLIRAKVQGEELYRQHIELGFNGREFWIDGECDCPVGSNCKHCVAVLLYLIEKYESTGTVSRSNEWLTRFINLYTKPSDEKYVEKTDLLIFRLYQESNSDFSFYKAKHLKKGGLSKGQKISTENMFYYYNLQYQYNYEYLTATDRKLIAQLSATKVSVRNYTMEYRFRDEYGAFMLKTLAKSGKCYYRDNSAPLSFDDTPKKLTFKWREEEGGYRMVSNLFETEELVPGTRPPICIDFKNNRVCEVETEYEKEALISLFRMPLLSADEMNNVTKTIVSKLPDVHFPLPKTLEKKRHVVTPQVALYLYSKKEENQRVPVMELHFFYGQYECNCYPYHAEESFIEDETIHSVVRSDEKEVASREVLENSGFVYDFHHNGFISLMHNNRQEEIEQWRLFLEETIPGLKEEGWQIEIDEAFEYSFSYADSVTIESEEGGEVNPWFELSFNVDVGGESIALLPIVSSLLEQYDSVEALPEHLNLEFKDGHFLHIKSKEIEPILRTIFELFDKQEGENLVIKPFDAHLLALDEESSIVWKGGKELRELSQKLKDFKEIESITPAKSLNATLRSYQQFGLDWLYFLHTFRFAGILADDMGLGKTVQTLAFLQYLKSRSELEGPTLIILPTSLIGNWKNEIQKFTPDLTYLELYGIERMKKFQEIDQHDIILTTYQLVQRDQERYEKRNFFYIILDEAQKIKNPKTKMALAIKGLNASHRLALSGTPIENHLGELWSIFDFLMPGFLENLKFFKSLYQNPIEKEHDIARGELLNRKVAPFILRRTKEQVALELPSKTEIVKKAIFDKKQAALYENIRITMEKKVRDTISEKGLSRSHITILDALLKLRQVCCHPQLLKLSAAKKVTESAKLELFIELLDELHEEGRKVLVFSQFTSMLSILETVIKEKKYRYTKLTGATRKREEAIEKFTSGNADIFLISLKAGGVGLNLVAADTVIHYDPWWNPAVENQATDRAYRIGQDKPVFVYKLIVENSIEEQILKLQEKKRTLQNSIYAKEKDEKERFSGDELMALLKL